MTCDNGETKESCPQDCIGITPLPQIATYKNQQIIVDNTWQIVFDKNLKNIDNTVNILKSTILDTLQINLITKSKKVFITDYVNISGRENSNIFLMLHNDAFIREYFAKQQSQIYNYSKYIGNKGFDQGYLLFSYNNSIFILANSAKGIYYGVQSLRQMLESQGNIISSFNIIDWPDIEYRTFYNIGHENSNKLADPTIGLQYLQKISRHKINSVHLSSGSMSQNMDNMFIPYVEYCIKNFIRPIIGQSFSFSIEQDVEGLYVSKEPFIFNIGDTAIPVINGSVLINPDFENGNKGSIPVGWFVNNNSLQDGQWLLTEQMFYSGAKSVMLKRNSSSGLSQPMIYQKRSITPDSHYLARFKVKTVASSGNGRYQFVLVYSDVNGTNLNLREYNYTAIDDGKWHTISVHLAKNSDAKQVMLWIRPRGVFGTIYVDDIEFIRMNSKLSNVLLEGGHLFQVTNQSDNIKYREGIDFLVTKTGPDLTRTTVKELTNQVTIARIPSGKIGPGEMVRISYDYLFYQDKSTIYNINPFTPYAYDRIKLTLSQIANQFEDRGISKNEFDVFLGQDEIRGFNMDSRSIQANMENDVAMAMHFNKLYSIAKEVFTNSKVFFWADMVNLFHNGKNENYQVNWGGKSGATYRAANLINKSIILIPWDYSYSGVRINESVKYFNDAGFKIAGGAGGNIPNIKTWTSVLKNSNNYFYGHSIFAPELTKENTIPYFGKYSWNATNTTSASIPLTIDSVYATTDTTVVVIFSEVVLPTSTKAIENYNIQPTISITSTFLESDSQTVTLTVSVLSPGKTYTLSTSNIQKVAGGGTVSVNTTGSFTFLESGVDIQSAQIGAKAKVFSLSAFPNPTNLQTKISFSLPQTEKIELKVYDIRGNLIKSLVRGTKLPGSYTINWNGSNNRKISVPSGIYLIRLTTETNLVKQESVLIVK